MKNESKIIFRCLVRALWKCTKSPIEIMQIRYVLADFELSYFFQNKNSLELLSIIFENDSPKGSFGANKKKVEFLLLSPDSRKLLTTSLNKLAESTFVQSNGHLSSGEWARNKERTSYFPVRRWHAPRRLVALFLSSTKFDGDVFSLVNASTRLESDVKSSQCLLPTMWFLTILEEVYWRANQS